MGKSSHRIAAQCSRRDGGHPLHHAAAVPRRCTRKHHGATRSATPAATDRAPSSTCTRTSPHRIGRVVGDPPPGRIRCGRPIRGEGAAPTGFVAVNWRESQTMPPRAGPAWGGSRSAFRFSCSTKSDKTRDGGLRLRLTRPTRADWYESARTLGRAVWAVAINGVFVGGEGVDGY